MPESDFLLRFETRAHAASVLGALGIELRDEPATPSGDVATPSGDLQTVTGEPAFEDGVLRRLTGETSEFEGEAISFSVPQSGYHVRLKGIRVFPEQLSVYRVTGGPD